MQVIICVQSVMDNFILEPDVFVIRDGLKTFFIDSCPEMCDIFYQEVFHILQHQSDNIYVHVNLTMPTQSI